MSIEDVIYESEVLLLSGKPEEALIHLKETGEDGMKDAAVRNKLGVCYVSLGRALEAEAEFKAALAIDNEYAPAYTNLGSINKEKGDVLRAIELYERAIQADPTYSNAYHNLGVLYNGEGRYDKGIPIIKTAKQLELGKGDVRRGKRKQLLWRYSWVAIAFVLGAAIILLTRAK